MRNLTAPKKSLTLAIVIAALGMAGAPAQPAHAGVLDEAAKNCKKTGTSSNKFNQTTTWTCTNIFGWQTCDITIGGVLEGYSCYNGAHKGAPTDFAAASGFEGERDRLAAQLRMMIERHMASDSSEPTRR